MCTTDSIQEKHSLVLLDGSNLFSIVTFLQVIFLDVYMFLLKYHQEHRNSPDWCFGLCYVTKRLVEMSRHWLVWWHFTEEINQLHNWNHTHRFVEFLYTQDWRAEVIWHCSQIDDCWLEECVTCNILLEIAFQSQTFVCLYLHLLAICKSVFIFANL